MFKEWAIDDRQQLHKDANKALDQNLLNGENVKTIIRGTYDAAMIGTDRRVFVFKKGWLSGVGGGSKLSSWDYANITGVQLEVGMGSGVVAIQAPGVPAVDVSYWSSGPNSPQKAPNAIAIVKDHFEQARQGVAELRRLISLHQDSGRLPECAPPGILGMIRQLGELHASGILTKDEFETKKAELLMRL